jgi:hypothetical protein
MVTKVTIHTTQTTLLTTNVCMLAWSVVDHEPQSGQTKDYKIVICCYKANHAALRRKSKK